MRGTTIARHFKNNNATTVRIAAQHPAVRGLQLEGLLGTLLSEILHQRLGTGPPADDAGEHSMQLDDVDGAPDMSVHRRNVLPEHHFQRLLAVSPVRGARAPLRRLAAH